MIEPKVYDASLPISISRPSVMSSIHFDSGAISALSTLRDISAQLSSSQVRIASGHKISAASDNSAYWSIATTMRSDNENLTAVSDMLGLASATVDVAYAGMTAVVDVLSEVKAKVIAAMAPGADREKVQLEVAQLQQHAEDIISASSYNNLNWLSADLEDDILGLREFATSITGSFGRDANGNIEFENLPVDLKQIALINKGGGAILQKEGSALGTIGGFRDTNINTVAHNGHEDHEFTGPATFNATDYLTFTLTVDASVHSTGVAHTVRIDKPLIDAALGTTDGVIGTALEM